MHVIVLEILNKDSLVTLACHLCLSYVLDVEVYKYMSKHWEESMELICEWCGQDNTTLDMHVSNICPPKFHVYNCLSRPGSQSLSESQYSKSSTDASSCPSRHYNALDVIFFIQPDFITLSSYQHLYAIYSHPSNSTSQEANGNIHQHHNPRVLYHNLLLSQVFVSTKKLCHKLNLFNEHVALQHALFYFEQAFK